MIEYLSKTEVQEFIREHQNDDPAGLMLSSERSKWLHFDKVVEQIQSRQKAKGKLTEWLNTQDILFPPPLSVEQASSEQAAKMKRELVNAGDSMLDLTGGYGLDCYFLSKKFQKTIYVERSDWLCRLAEHNFKLLNSSIQVVNAEAEEYLSSADAFDLIYLDPARRDDKARKVFKLSDCSPDVSAIQNELLDKGSQVLIKLSPLLDIKSVIAELDPIKSIHIHAIKNEVKELLVLLEANYEGIPKVHCLNMTQNGSDTFTFDYEIESASNVPFSGVRRYLYEPNAAILKGGGFKSIADYYRLFKLHPNTHLYTSSELIPSFPGRIFEVYQSLPIAKKKIKKVFPEMKANISTRNYPLSVEAIRTKTGIIDGGEHYLFACTGQEGKLFLLTQKVKQNSHDDWG